MADPRYEPGAYDLTPEERGGYIEEMDIPYVEECEFCFWYDGDTALCRRPLDVRLGKEMKGGE